MGEFLGFVLIAFILYLCGCEIEKGFNKINKSLKELKTQANLQRESCATCGSTYCPKCGSKL